MNNNFSELGIDESIKKALDDMGFTKPTKVQNDSIPYILNKKDLIVLAKTGSGKTGAFGIPLIQSVDVTDKSIQGLILTPTRELAVQVDQELVKMSKYTDLKTTVVYGQHNINTEIEEIKKGASVVTGTPGRVFDHISRKTLSTKNIRYLVLDEADRMLDMGFFDQVVKIIKQLPTDRVTLLFSATMPPEIQRMCQAYMKEPVTLELGSDTKTVDSIEQIYYKVDSKEKRTQLNKILKVEQPDSCIIFCNTRKEVDWVDKYLHKKGYTIGALHGGNTQTSRMKTMQKFKDKKLQIIVATDVAARGLHVDELSLVINYDVPGDKDSYIHRIGRTGRIGNKGKAITLVTTNEMWSFYEIEEHVGVLIEELDLPTDDFVKTCEESSKSEWTRLRIDKAKQLAERGNRQDEKHQKPHQKHGQGKQNKQNNQKKHVEHKHKKKVQRVNIVVPEVKSEPKNIDYRAEAQKLLGKNKTEQKPTIIQRIFGLFK